MPVSGSPCIASYPPNCDGESCRFSPVILWYPSASLNWNDCPSSSSSSSSSSRTTATSATATVTNTPSTPNVVPSTGKSVTLDSAPITPSPPSPTTNTVNPSTTIGDTSSESSSSTDLPSTSTISSTSADVSKDVLDLTTSSPMSATESNKESVGVATSGEPIFLETIPTSTTGSSDESSNNSSGFSSNQGFIAGIVVGLVVASGLIFAAVFLCYKQRKQQNPNQAMAISPLSAPHSTNFTINTTFDPSGTITGTIRSDSISLAQSGESSVDVPPNGSVGYYEIPETQTQPGYVAPGAESKQYDAYGYPIADSYGYVADEPRELSVSNDNDVDRLQRNSAYVRNESETDYDIMETQLADDPTNAPGYSNAEFKKTLTLEKDAGIDF
eukprot:m.197076 g.197076  ORF g.197076 m.197076 type:complete len:386 (+) comp15707_c0_seq5:1882-3039(+)